MCQKFGQLKEIKADIDRKYGTNAYIFVLDVTKYNDVVKFTKKILEDVKKIDVLINNAGACSRAGQVSRL